LRYNVIVIEQIKNNYRGLWAELILLGFAAIFLVSNGLALSVARRGEAAWEHLRPIALWAVIIVIALVLLQRYAPQHDPILFALYAFLTGWGLVLQARLAPAFIGRFELWFTISTALLTATATLPRNLNLIRRYRYTLLLSGIALLALTLIFGVNPIGSGAALWLPVPFLTAYFQPSELLKLLFIFFFASYFADRGRIITAKQEHNFWYSLPYLAPLFVMWGFCILLLVWQQDLGAASIFFVLFLSMLYTATGKRRYLVVGLLLLIVAGFIGYAAYDLIALRIDAWLNPWPNVFDRSFQVVQSLYALAAGGIAGGGVGQGFPTFIPVVHSDFVFAAIAEEWGLLGTLAVVACFALLAQRGLRIALLAKSAFRTYLGVGIVVLISVQAFLIMGGVTKLLPLTGVTLPFLSYGGSSLVMASGMVGLLLYLSRSAESPLEAFHHNQ
jgi:peptidoglycan glycosyltransferase